MLQLPQSTVKAPPVLQATAPKLPAVKMTTAPVLSEIIVQSTVYLQAMAAYEAGFRADATGDWDYAGAGSDKLGGRQLCKASKALAKLVALSPAFAAGRVPLTREELFAKAAVMAVVSKQLEVFAEPDKVERETIRLFAQEVTDYLSAARS